MPVTIDAHHHLWRLDQPAPFDYRWLDAPAHAPIRRNFLPADLEPLIRSTGVDRTVVVQTQHNTAENHWALALADRHPFIAGVVGWVDLRSSDCEAQLLEVKDHPKFVGVRHVTQDEPDDDFIVRDEVVAGLKVLEKHGVPFDLLFYVKHLRHVPELARRLPDLPMVIDHLAKPRIREGVTEGWLADFRAAAEFPNVFCKLSGMVTEADWSVWTVNHLRPYVGAALDAFGPDRLMFGSDWPVCELASPYARVHETAGALLTPLGETDRQKIFGGTAARFYSLAV